MRALGAILIVLGIVALVWGGISYTKREKVIDVGPIEASVDERKTIPLPPVAVSYTHLTLPTILRV